MTFRLPKNWKREHGIALLMTLAIISLLMILAMSFAFTSQGEQQAASAHGDLVKARMLSESALNRALGFLRNDLDGTHYPAADPTLFYQIKTTKNAGRYVNATTVGGDVDTQLAKKFVTKFDGETFFYDISFDPRINSDTKLAEYVDWQLIRPDTTDSVVGRLAYIIIDESGKLDPAVVVQNQLPVAEGSEVRVGLSDTEIDLDAMASFVTTTETAAALPFLSSASDLVPTTGSTAWSSWSNLLRANLGQLASPKDQLAYQALFPNSYDIEAYFDSSKHLDRHRFNLAQSVSAWNSQTVAGLIDTGTAFYNSTDSGIQASAGGIQWFQAQDVQAKRIAANIIDYCDAGSQTTNDYNGTTATYVGLEKVPYLSEISFQVQRNSSNLEVSPEVELVNMYGADISASFDVFVEASFDVDGSSVGPIVFGWTSGNSISISSADTYKSSTGSLKILASGLGPGATSCQVTAVRALVAPNGTNTIGSVTSSNLLDFMQTTSASGVGNMPASGGARYAYLAVRDPRSNEDESFWGISGGSPWRGFGGTTPTTNARNTTDSLTDATGKGADGDVETDPDPINSSTVHIANAPMKYLWELGCIHRGSPWQTLNLHAYNTKTNALGDYADGDANILDQVKVDNRTIHRGGFNVNSTNKAAWEAVLSRIKVGGSYGNPGGASTNLADPTDLAALAAAVIAGQPAKPGWYDRGSIASVAELTTDSVQTTDRLQEEVVCKMANFLTARPNYFTILCLAQSLKDLGKIPLQLARDLEAIHGSQNVVKYSSDEYALVLGEHKMMAVVYRDALTGELRVERIEELNE